VRPDGVRAGARRHACVSVCLFNLHACQRVSGLFVCSLGCELRGAVSERASVLARPPGALFRYLQAAVQGVQAHVHHIVWRSSRPWALPVRRKSLTVARTLDGEGLQHLKQVVDENPRLFLDEIALKLKNERGSMMSEASVCRYLMASTSAV